MRQLTLALLAATCLTFAEAPSIKTAALSEIEQQKLIRMDAQFEALEAEAKLFQEKRAAIAQEQQALLEKLCGRVDVAVKDIRAKCELNFGKSDEFEFGYVRVKPEPPKSAAGKEEAK